MDINKQFIGASDDRVDNGDGKINASKAVNAAVRQFAEVLDKYLHDGRNKSLAVTHLEDVQMRANRSIFSEIG